MIRIERVTKENLKELVDHELSDLRVRFNQIWKSNFKGNQIEFVGALSRTDIEDKYRMLVKEMTLRRIPILEASLLDQHIFDKSIYKISTHDFGDIVLVPDFLTIAGSYVRDPEGAGDVDVIVRAPEESRDPSHELKITRALQKHLKKDIEYVYHSAGPHSSYISFFDLVLRAKDSIQVTRVKESPVRKKAGDFELAIIGTGAMDSPRKDESLMIAYKLKHVLIDAGKDIKAKDLPVKTLHRILLCDPESRYVKDAKRLAKQFKILDPPGVGEWILEDLSITPFEVKHTNHKTYGYKIMIDKKKIIYAPEFYEFPAREAKDADLAILEGSAWDKSIDFVGGVGGHAPILETWKKAKDAGVKKILFTHIGKPVERNLDKAKELGIDIAHDGQKLKLDEISKKLTPQQQKEVDEETERIRRNSKQAKFPHEFMPARWTHKNGHPRCLICGDEETTDGICRGLEKATIRIGHPFTPLKSAGGYGKFEFGSLDELVDVWAQGYFDIGIAVETKFDGFRVQIHKYGDEIKIFSEDAKRDLSGTLAELDKELKSFKDNFILDGELLIYTPQGEKVERKDMPTYVMTKDPPPFKAKIYCFDCLYYHNTPLDNSEWRDRQDTMQKIFAGVDELGIEKVVPTIAKSEVQFRAAVKKHSAEKHSEGAMCKVINSKYPLKGSTTEWAKFKNLKEIRCKVKEAEAKEGGGWIYVCTIAQGIPIGRTYATKIKASIGSILEVAVAEVKYDEEKDSFTWDNPIVRSLKPSGTALTTKQQAIALSKLKRTKAGKVICECLSCGYTMETEEHCIDLKCPKCGGEMRRTERPGSGQLSKDEEGHASEFGNIDFKVGDKGTAIMQIHSLGISEDEKAKLEKDEKKILIARQDPLKLQRTLMDSVGQHGAHLDIRMRRGKDNFWEGGEIMVGNYSGLNKLQKLNAKGKLRFAWKQSRAGESKMEVVRGSLGWMKIGDRSIHFFNPGESGASANEYAFMLLMDSFEWELYLADEHAKKFRFKNRYFSGNYLVAFVPVTEAGKKGERVWMISKLKESDYEESINKRLPETLPIFKVDEDQQIVGGIVYEPHAEDSQGDYSTEDEIRQACYYFMENKRKFKLQHEGAPITAKINILENYIAPQDLEISKEKVKKGSWILIIRVQDPELWKLVKEGKVTGFSMAGVARRKKTKSVD